MPKFIRAPQVILQFPDREFSEIEAMWSVTQDYHRGKGATVSGYASQWQWTRNKARRFLEKCGFKIDGANRLDGGSLINPDLENNERTPNGHQADTKRTSENNKTSSLQKDSDTKRTPSGHQTDTTNKIILDINKYTPQFEQAWAAWPGRVTPGKRTNKGDKKQSLKSYNRMAQKFTHEQIMEAIKNQAEEVRGQAQTFLKDFERWLNEQKIEEYLTPIQSQPSTGIPSDAKAKAFLDSKRKEIAR